MKTFSLPALAILAVVTLMWMQKPDETTFSEAAYAPQAEMLKAARTLAASFSPEQRDSATFPFEAEDRKNWHFTPYPHTGIDWRALSEAQHDMLIDLLKTGLSSRGYERTREIMEMENMLRILEERPDDDERRNPERYYFSLFGSPSESAPWGWRFEGHHVSLNFSSVGEELVITPTFFGSNPHRVPVGPTKGFRILDEEEDMARAFMASLNTEQLETTLILEEAPAEMITANHRQVSLDKFEGIPYTDLDGKQQKALRELIQLYLKNHPSSLAKKQWKQVEAGGLENLYFAWAGTLTPGEGHYYRIHGPNLLIEYDNTQNDANHVHTVLRDPTNDWGDDLLKKHYEAAGHGH